MSDIAEDTAATDSATLRSASAARAEAYAASLAGNGEQDIQVGGIIESGLGRVHLHSGEDYVPHRSASGGEDAATPEGAAQLLGRPWAIMPDALVEIGARIMRGDRQTVDVAEKLKAAPVRRGAQRVTASGGQIAVIPLRGTITPRGSWLSLLFGGGGGLQSFRAAFREALADDDVGSILIDIDSPGGQVDLVQETADEIRAARGQGKRIVAISNTLCASAAYWIAAQADELVVTPSGQVGSIGVFTLHEDYSRLEQAMGITTTIISAGQFKTDGNPYEPLSKTARTAIQSQVDELYGMFTASVAAGRGVSQAAVQAGYGRGRCLLATQALQIGMVDSVEPFESTVARLGGGAQDPAPTVTDVCPDDDEDLAPEAGAEVPHTQAAEADSDQPVADYLNRPALREQPAWLLQPTQSRRGI